MKRQSIRKKIGLRFRYHKESCEKQQREKKSFIGEMDVAAHGNVMQRYIKQLLEKKKPEFCALERLMALNKNKTKQ